MKRMTKTELHKKSRDLLKKDRLGDAIQLIDDFLQKNPVKDKYFADSLITLSAKHRNLRRSEITENIPYESYKNDRAKLFNGIMHLVDEIPHLEIRRETINNSGNAMTLLMESQDRQFQNLRGEMLETDTLIIDLFDELRKKEEELISKSQAEVIYLKTEIETLKERIVEEEKKYENLREKYERLKNDQGQVSELQQEIKLLKEKLATRKEHIDILVQQQIWSNQHLDQKNELIETLQKQIKKLQNGK